MNTSPENILYIAPDEEITSLIARLREAPSNKTTFVFPKQSLITQSSTNLKLLSREAQRIGKEVTIVAQDESVRGLAEKIGLRTMAYSAEFRESKPLSLQPQEIPAEVFEEAFSQKDVEEAPAEPKLSSSDIGSSGFYTERQKNISPHTATMMSDVAMPEHEEDIPQDMPVPKQIRVRNASPERPPGLNSVRMAEEVAETNQRSINGVTDHAPSIQKHQEQLDVNMTMHKSPLEQERVGMLAQEERESKRTPGQTERFFQGTSSQVKDIPTYTTKLAQKEKSKKLVSSKGTGVSQKKVHFSHKWLVGLFVVLVGGGVIAFSLLLILPEATVHITPYTLNESSDKTLTLNSNSTPRLEVDTQEVGVELPGIATGALSASAITAAAESGERASGTIRITNNYSSEDQQLVATTRFQTEDGRIYRIPVAVTVPGNGSVETKVVADAPGEAYNLESGSLTIPGFKGTAKFSQFSVETTTPLTGGSGESTGGNTLGTFIAADAETLHTRAADKAKETYLSTLHEGQNDGNMVFQDAIEAELIAEENLPATGSVPSEYTYKAKYKLTIYKAKTDDLMSEVERNIKTDYDGVAFAPQKQDLEVTGATLTKDDQGNPSVEVKLYLDASLVSQINESALKDALAGISNADLPDILKQHPEVKELSIEFSPSWALQKVPKNKEKIAIRIEESKNTQE